MKIICDCGNESIFTPREETLGNFPRGIDEIHDEVDPDKFHIYGGDYDFVIRCEKCLNKIIIYT